MCPSDMLYLVEISPSTSKGRTLRVSGGAAAGGMFTEPTWPRHQGQPRWCCNRRSAGCRPCSGAAGPRAATCRPAVWHPAGPRPTLYHWCRACRSPTLVQGPAHPRPWSRALQVPDPGPGTCRSLTLVQGPAGPSHPRPCGHVKGLL